MRIIISLIILFLSINKAFADAPNIVIFGDSLSAGYGIEIKESWSSLLQSRLKEQGYIYEVINASISGETTEGGATRIDSILKNFSPDLLILELGGNDGLRGFPPERIKKNLEKIIIKTKSSGAEIVLLGIRIPTNYGTRYSKEFENVFRNISYQFKINWIEFFMKDIAFNDDLLQEDRIHPNTDAQPILLNNAWPIIKDTLEKVE
ncbi:MAG: arylesterase [Gammaproteobacteria bacterium]|nr:arylesterase [Gammaproteobacteria bacterium]|tara:strand:+ start:670 stop:1287 length:618 start_codon:yes stop_codon:yes gene_type:complete